MARRWPLTEHEIEIYSTGQCFLFAWALAQLARHPTDKVILSWLPDVDADYALHAAYVTADGHVIDAKGIRLLAAHMRLYSTDGWYSEVVPVQRLERDGYVFPEDEGPHSEALEVAERLIAYL